MSDNLPRPTVFTKEAQLAIIAALTDGNYLTTACEAAGVSTDAFYYWQNLWKAGDGNAQQFADFFGAVKKASATAEKRALGDLKGGAPGWQALAWFLERRFPKRWGKQDRAEVPPDFTKMTNEQIDEYIKSGGRRRP